MLTQKELFDQSLERLNAYLDTHALKHSPERERLLKHICQQQRLFATSDLLEWSKDDHISRATVYNTMRVLVAAEILHATVKVNGHKLQYRLFCDRQNHIQMICTRCGRTVNLNDALLHNMIVNKKYNNFNLKHYTLFVYGECKTCRRKPKNA